MVRSFIFTVVLFTEFGLWAAPIPGTSTSGLMSAKPGIFYSEHGFTLDAGKSTWIQSEAPKDIPALATLYVAPKSPSGSQASLSVRVDQLKQDLSVRHYVKQWMKDYPKLGFQVLDSKPVKVNGQNAFLIDVFQREMGRQLRQVIFVKNRVAVVLICRDSQNTFDESAKVCTNIVRTFRWN
jgi:hypothetical protein